MATETTSYVDTFWKRQDAIDFLENLIDEFAEEFFEEDGIIYHSHLVKDYEIKLMPSGGYRAGIVFEKKV